jgi:NADH-quinone oxidoreductase subunit E
MAVVMALKEAEREQIEAAASEFPQRRSALISALRIVQESRGCVDKDAMRDLAEAFDLHPMEVEEVATFYTMINTRPVGKHLIQVCRSISCFIMGANPLLRHLEKRLGIRPGETTKDGKFTLVEVECLGSCGTAPVMQIGEDYHEDLTPEKVEQILGRL